MENFKIKDTRYDRHDIKEAITIILPIIDSTLHASIKIKKKD